MSGPNIRVGRRVLFVGGPEAGNVRNIPESEGDNLVGPGEYLYKIWPFSIPGDSRIIYFAYRADGHPTELLIDLWREYSPAAQIKREGVASTYGGGT